MRDCDNCIRNIPGKGCTSWDCEYINRAEAIGVWLNHKDDGQTMYARGYEAGYNKAVSIAEGNLRKALFGE